MKYKSSMLSTIVVLGAFLCIPAQAFAVLLLGKSESFAVLGSSTVTNTGTSVVTGDLGVDPGSAIVGFDNPGGPGVVNGTIHAADGASFQAQNDAALAWAGLKNLPFTGDLTGENLGSRTLMSGVYHFDTSAQLTGMLTLDAQDQENAFWVFQIGSTLTTASASSVMLINPGLNNGIFWQVGSSATLGTSTSFLGNILTDQSVTLTSNANILCGRAIALNGAVTMDTNNVSAVCDAGFGYSGGLELNGSGDVVPISGTASIPEPLTLSLLGLGLLGLKFNKNKIA